MSLHSLLDSPVKWTNTFLSFLHFSHSVLPPLAYSISLIFPSTVSSVCSLIDRTEIKINIGIIPTSHPLVSIRSSLSTLGLDKVPIHPLLPSLPGTSLFRMTEQRWASKMRDETRRGKESVLPQGHSSEQLIGDTYRCPALCVHILLLWGINKKLCSSNLGSRWEREKVKYSIVVTNCKLAIDFPSMWLRHKAHVQTHNSLWRPNACTVLHSKKHLCLDHFHLFTCKSRISREHHKCCLLRHNKSTYLTFKIQLYGDKF